MAKTTLAALVVKLGLTDGELDAGLAAAARKAGGFGSPLEGTIETGIGFDPERGIVAMPPESPDESTV